MLDRAPIDNATHAWQARRRRLATDDVPVTGILTAIQERLLAIC